VIGIHFLMMLPIALLDPVPLNAPGEPAAFSRYPPTNATTAPTRMAATTATRRMS
jgi:hypothetical protein